MDTSESDIEDIMSGLKPRGFRLVATRGGDGAPVACVFPVEGYRADADALCAEEASAPGATLYSFPSYADMTAALMSTDGLRGVLKVGFCAGKGYVWYDRPEPGSDRFPPEASVRQLMASGCPIPHGAVGHEAFRATQTMDHPDGVVRFNGTSCAVRIVRAAKALDPDLCGDDVAQLLEACLK